MGELMLLNGRVRTMDPALDRKEGGPEALAVRDGRILAVGDNRSVKEALGPGAREVDLAGALVLPGLTDSHVHFYDWSLARQDLALIEARDLAGVLQMVARAAKAAEPGGWILGRGLDETRWPEGRLPLKQDLDRAAPDNPVWLYRRDMHLAVANSKALARAGVGPETAPPPGGRVDRDQEGRPTGILREKAIDLVACSIPAPGPERVKEAMLSAQKHLLSLGLTGVHDTRVWDGACGAPAFRALQDLDREGLLQLKIWMNLPGQRLEEMIDLGLTTGFGSEHLKVGHLKFFADGSMGSRTAWVLEPFEGGGSGLPVCSMDDLALSLSRADSQGLAVSVHAIGDRANQEVISILEGLAGRSRAGLLGRDRTGPRHRIEHAQLIRPEMLPRLARLGVVASVQPLHISDDIPLHDGLLGERARYAYPFREMIDQGVILTAGSDTPVSDPNPWWGIHAAVTRQRRDGTPRGGWFPGQRLSVAEAAAAYTLGPAAVTGRRAELGTLTPGMRADLTVVDRDIFSIDPMEIASARAVMTVVQGRVVFEG